MPSIQPANENLTEEAFIRQECDRALDDLFARHYARHGKIMQPTPFNLALAERTSIRAALAARYAPTFMLDIG